MRKPVEFAQHPRTLSIMEFRAVVKHVVDGDTLDVLCDLGFNQYTYITLRLRGINTPELVGTRGAERDRALGARGRVAALVLDKPVFIQTYKDQVTFGRYVATVWFWDAEGRLTDLNRLLVAEGWAEVL